MTTPQTHVDAHLDLIHAYAKAYVNTNAPAFTLARAWSAVEASACALAAIPEQQAGGVPAGFVLVPVELTEAMEDAGEAHIYAPTYRNDLDRIWAAMLSASPSPSAVQPLSEAQIEVLRFLDGVGGLRGFHFGEKPPTERGNYWWRKDLRAAFPDVDFGIVTKEST